MLDEVLARQEGVVARWQVLACGLTAGALKARVSGGRWQRIYAGVYAAFSGPPSRGAILWAAVLRAGPDAVLSHHTAAELDGLTDDVRPEVHVTVPSDRYVTVQPPAADRERWSPPSIRVHYSSRLAAARHPMREPPRTRIEETVLDLTQIDARPRRDGRHGRDRACGGRGGLDEAIAWIAAACQRRLTTADRLLAAMSARAWMRWRAELTAALTDIGGGAHTLLELRYVRYVERPHQLPQGLRQVAVGPPGADPGDPRPDPGGPCGDGRRRYRDIDYPDYRTAVELDGWFTHPLERRWLDMDRDNLTVARGEVPLRFGWDHVTRSPCRVAALVAFVLNQRGWTGTANPCGPGCEVPMRGPAAMTIKDRGSPGCPDP
ncbi:hypothetical protein [Actinomadura sp. HBU206391]|uniref:hypothetical protein n=1 Tax=Actinomadura sp. HBU206391 TaxID=2731692 RepID=UPI001650A794|nr:hypothetical protein [Actinomadura sp. HBU206391]MBC6459638.1 hypothetical protein [Actinomadura sp. HBU206391]